MSAKAADAVAESLGRELDRQLGVLLERGYGDGAGLDAEELRERVDALRPLLTRIDPAGPIPFVVVVGRELVAPAVALERVQRDGAPAVSMLDADELDRFLPIDALELPASAVYLLADVDAGADLRDVTPDAALSLLLARGRTPLTVEEGIALVTQLPEAVVRGAGFSLLGSRCGDRRVPALWIARDAVLKLGWCWAGNPHSWLGSASGALRLADG